MKGPFGGFFIRIQSLIGENCVF